MKKILTASLLIVILFGGFLLRKNGFATTPPPGESTDEYSNAWVGLSLLQIGYPVGISGLPSYGEHDFRYINVDRVFSSNTVMGNAMPIDRPWFDHPPMMGLMTGSFAYLKGARVFEDASAVIIRKPVLVLSVLTIGLIFWLGTLIAGARAGLLSSLFYSISPLMVINSRLVQAENGFLPLFLLSTIFIYYFEKKKQTKYLYLSAVIAGLAVLFKLSAVSVTLSSLILLVSVKQDKTVLIKNITRFVIVVGGFLSLFLTYGFAYDWNLFVKTFLSNSGRKYGIGLQAVYELITISKVTGKKYLTDGWPLAGWLSILALSFKDQLEKYKYVFVPLISYLCTYLFFGSESFGWYRIPTYPFLFISLAILIQKSMESGFVTLSSLILLSPIGLAGEKLLSVDKAIINTSVWRYCIPLLLALSVLLSANNFKISKSINRAILLVVILLAVYASIKYNQIIDISYWYKTN